MFKKKLTKTLLPYTARARAALRRLRNTDPVKQIGDTVVSEAGDFYISDAVKVIIAVVLGALLLMAMTGLFNNTVIPRITQEIEGLFS